MKLKDGEFCRFLVSIVSDSKVQNILWCSDLVQVNEVRNKLGKQYGIEVQDLTWTDSMNGYSIYAKEKRLAIAQNCSYFCTDLLFGTHGIVDMSRRTGDSFYEIRRSIKRGWKSSNGHRYEKLNRFREED